MTKIRIASYILSALAIFTLGWSGYLVLIALRSPAWLLLPAVLGATAMRGWWMLHELKTLNTKLEAP